MYTNADIRKCSTFLFAHTPSLNEQGVFTGREVEQKAILDALGDGSGHATLAVTAPLGGGKTFLLNVILSHLEQQHVISASEVRDAIVSIRSLTPSVAKTLVGCKILVIEELDRKEQRTELVKQLERVRRLVTSSFPYVVLCGDETLTDIDTWRQVMDIKHEVTVVPLGPVTPQFFLEALEKRAQFYTPEQSDGIRELIDPEVLRYLLPATDPPIGTFRDVFAVLMDIAKDEYYGIPLNDDVCRISPEVCKEWAEGLAPVTDDRRQLTFLEWLQAHMRQADNRGDTLKALETEQCMSECPFPGITTPAEYEAAILVPLATTEVLRGCGLPYVGGSGGPYQETPPYLPTLRTWLSAMFDEFWP